MKKLSIFAAIFLAFTLVFSSVGSTILFGEEQTAEAKSYKSGKKGFTTTPGSTNTNIQNKDADTNTSAVNKNTNTTKGGFTSGGLMRGLFVGGLAGLLFGSLFADMGLLGNILGFAINALAIIAIVVIIMKIWQMMTRKKNKEVTETWKR